MGSVLFLDDDKHRRSVFSEIVREGAHVNMAVDARTAIAFLGGGDWSECGCEYDVVSLDHDLCEDHYKGYVRECESGVADYGCVPTGLKVAEYMVEHVSPATKVVVHTYNDRAAMRMVDVLSKKFVDVVYAPFAGDLYLETMRRWHVGN